MPITGEEERKLRQWLLSEARILNQDCSGTVDLLAVASKFDAAIRFEEPSGGRSGLLQTTSEGRALITISGASNLSPRTRFTLAHELGHLLLLREWGYRPATFSDNRAYYQMEEICNFFAGKLLVPQLAVTSLHFEVVSDLIRSLRNLAKRCSVSEVVAALELVDHFADIGFMELVSTSTDRKGSPRWLVRWACGFAQAGLSYRRSQKLGVSDPLIKVLLATGSFGSKEFELRLSKDVVIGHCPSSKGGGSLLGFANIHSH